MFKKIVVSALVISLLLPNVTFASGVKLPATPTLLTPKAGSFSSEVKPLITGLTQNNTQVAVYIDNVYNGQATVKNGAKDTASFAYRPFLNLKPGWHKIKVKAQNQTQKLESPVSAEQSFYVEYPLPAPVLKAAVVNSETNWQKPWLTGVATNNTSVKVYIDGQYNGLAQVKNGSASVGTFAYKPFLALAAGNHTCYTVAQDSHGKQSSRSETLTFKVTAPVTASAVKKNISNVEVKNKATQTETEKPDKTSEQNTIPTAGPESKTDTNKQDNASTFGWLLLIMVTAGLVYRNRKDSRAFFKEQELPAAFKPDPTPPPKSVEVINRKTDDSQK